MDGWAVEGGVVIPDGEVFGDGEGFAVADDHADDFVVRDPGADVGSAAHLGEADLILGSFLVVHGARREGSFVGTPAHFGGGDAFFAEAFDGPGIDELIDFFGFAGDLGIAFGDMDGFDAEVHGEVVVLTGLEGGLDEFAAWGFFVMVVEPMIGDVLEGFFGEVLDEARVGAVVEDGGRAVGVFPGGEQFAESHMAVVEGSLGWGAVGGAFVGVPDFDGGIDVADAVVVAPLEDIRAADIPGEVDDDVAFSDVLGELFAHGGALDFFLDEASAGVGDDFGGGDVFEVHDGDFFAVHLEVFEEEWESTAGDRAEADDEDFAVEFHDRSGTPCGGSDT